MATPTPTTPTPAQLNIESAGSVPPGALTSSSTNSSSGDSSDSAVTTPSSYIQSLIGTQAATDKGLLNDPNQAAALGQAVAGYASPYLAQLKAAFGNPTATTKELDAGLKGYDVPTDIANTIKGGNATEAKELASYIPAVQGQVADFVPGQMDSAVLGAYSAGLKYYLEGGFTSQQLDAMPGLQGNQSAMGLAQYMAQVFTGQTPGTVPNPNATPPFPTGQGVPAPSTSEWWNPASWFGSDQPGAPIPNAPTERIEPDYSR